MLEREILQHIMGEIQNKIDNYITIYLDDYYLILEYGDWPQMFIFIEKGDIVIATSQRKITFSLTDPNCFEKIVKYIIQNYHSAGALVNYYGLTLNTTLPDNTTTPI